MLLLGVSVYWAFTHLDTGIPTQIDQVVTTVEPVETPVVLVSDTPDVATEDPQGEEPEEEPVTVNLSDEQQDVLDALGRLIDDNIYMKKGSRGTRVGTVQKFLNFYFDTNKTVDNDYGPGTLADVKKFQSEEGLDADGLAGPATYKKMIEVLKQGS